MMQVKRRHMRRASRGVFSDEEVNVQRRDMDQLKSLKLLTAKYLREAYTPTSPYNPHDLEEISMLNKFFVSVIQESDADIENIALGSSLMQCVSLNYPLLIEENDLIAMAASDGSTRYLQAFLEVPGVSYDECAAFACAMFHGEQRIQMVLQFLNHFDTDQVRRVRENLWTEYNDFFADICDSKKAGMRENRECLLDLVEFMIVHPILKLDPDTTSGDGQTVLSRAAHDGDARLVELLVRNEFYGDPNRVLPDGTTLLIHAIFGGDESSVAAVLSIPGIDPNVDPDGNGTALMVANSLNRSDSIRELLLDAGAAQTLKQSRFARVPQLPKLENSGNDVLAKTVTLRQQLRTRARKQADSFFD
jgi:hypothetical protein